MKDVTFSERLNALCNDYYETRAEMLTAEKGYVIRSVDEFTGRVRYRGKKDKISPQKDALPINDTYSLTGARKALANLQRMYPDTFWSIERLSCCYINFESQTDPEDEKKRLLKQIDHAYGRLEELWEGNDFDNGDKMRINEVKAVLIRIKNWMLE